MLAGAYAKYPDELTADLQEIYGVNLWSRGNRLALMGDESTPAVRRLAALTAQLPPTSRIAQAEHTENAWTVTDYLIRNLEYQVRMLCWGLAGGDKAGPKPEPIYSPADIDNHAQMVERAEAMADTVASLLNIERG